MNVAILAIGARSPDKKVRANASVAVIAESKLLAAEAAVEHHASAWRKEASGGDTRPPERMPEEWRDTPPAMTKTESCYWTKRRTD